MNLISRSLYSKPLLCSKSFYPLFWVQFLGAFNDNLFKNSLVMLITFRLSQSNGETGLLITLAAGLFILPFFLFSSIAGQIADRYPKSSLIQKIKLTEVFIMMTGAIGLLNQQVELLFITLFLMGSQSAFFGPIKYSILPEVLEKERLLSGNALFSGSTFIAIVVGTLLGGMGILLPNGPEVMSVAIILVALVGYGMSLLVVPSQLHDRTLLIEWNVLKSTWQIIGACQHYRSAYFAILSISWFWLLGALLLSQIPALVKYDLRADDQVVMAFLSVFSIGIAIGSGLMSRFSDGVIHLRWHGLFLAIISLCLMMTVWVIQLTATPVEFGLITQPLHGIVQFLTAWPVNLSLIFLMLIAMVGGAYIVPLYTLLQTQTPAGLRARMVAVNNILNALFMVVSSILVMIGFAFSLNLLTMIFILAVINLLIAVLFYLYQKTIKLA